MTFKRNAKLFLLSYAYTMAACIIAAVIALKVSKLLGLVSLIVLVFVFLLAFNRKAKKEAKND
ncbi:MAG: hypothetical protein ABIB71_06320 [Candidatus Woesearchaeota archaeon]